MFVPSRSFAMAFTLAALAGCSAAHPTLTVDGRPLDRADASATLTTGADRQVLELRVTDPGPPNVADAGISYAFRVELVPGIAAGASLDILGTATLDTDAIGGSVATRSFVGGAGHDARVLGVYLEQSCFCTSATTHFEQTVGGHLDIVEVTATSIVLEADLEVGGLPVNGFTSQRIHVVGHFVATTPTR